MPKSTVSAPSSTLPGSPNHRAPAYMAATFEKAPNISTSRLSHERFHMRMAR